MPELKRGPEPRLDLDQLGLGQEQKLVQGIGPELELGLELKLAQEQSDRELELEQQLEMELDVEQEPSLQLGATGSS